MLAIDGIRKPLLLALVSALLLLGMTGPRPARAADVSYTLTDVGSLIGASDGQFDDLTSVFASAINNFGAVAANANPTDDRVWRVAFTSDDGEIRRLGKLRSYSSAADINAAGDVVGFVTNLEDTGFAQTRAVIWRNGKSAELPSLGGSASQARAINDAGVIVGASALGGDAEGESHAVQWTEDVPVDLGTLGGPISSASDINSAGVVVGFSQLADRTGVVPFWTVQGSMEALPVPNELQGVASAVNDGGVVVGVAIDSADSSFVPFPTRWSDGEPEILPTLAEGAHGWAWGINGSGDIVGYSKQDPDNASEIRAVIWQDGTVFDLNERLAAQTTLSLTWAHAINDAGQIIADASSPGQTGTRAVLLTPIEETAERYPADVAAMPHATRRD